MNPNQDAVRRGRGANKKPVGGSRRVWSRDEEQVLISTLKELVNNGWKSENGFRTGYLVKIEDALKAAFPNTDLVINPNITSKLTTWKKAYGSLVSAQWDTTGVGWNTTTNTLDVTDEKWEEVVRKDPNMRGMRYKEWPMFLQWLEVFGKDRATGEVAEDLPDAADCMREQFHQPPIQPFPEFNDENNVDLNEGTGSRPEGSQGAGDNDENSTAYTKPTNQPSTSTSRKRKAKAITSDPDMVNMLGVLCRTTGDRLQSIASKIGYDHDLGVKRNQVFGLLHNVPGLSTTEKFDLSEIIGSKIEILEVFMGLPEAERALYALHQWARAKG